MRADSSRKNPNQLVVFGDVHYAAYWDHVAEVVGRRDDVINPNAELARFLTRMAGKTPDIAAVNLGDAIDYFLCDYGAEATPAANNRDLFYAALDSAGLTCDEIFGNHDHRLYPYNLSFWGLSQINLADAECRRRLASLGHARLRNPLTELRSVARLGSSIDPLHNFRGFRQATFARRASFNCFFLNTGGDLLGRASGIGVAAWRLMRAHMTGKRTQSGPPLQTLSVDCAGLSQADIDFIDRGLGACDAATTILFMHAPVLNSVCEAVGAEIKLRERGLRACLQAQGYAHNVIAAGGGRLLRMFRSAAHAERNVVIVAGHVHCARYILIDRRSLVARQVQLDELNAAWQDARYIKHVTVLPIGVIDRTAGGTRTGYGRLGCDGFQEVVLRRFDESQPPLQMKRQARSEPALEETE